MAPRRRQAAGKTDAEPAAAPAPPASPPEQISVSTKLTEAPAFRRAEPIVSFQNGLMLLLVVRLAAAAFATIPDCDEVFNFWEPAHYLSHGYGLQTWEYSPVYAIRSWAYVGVHAVLSRVFIPPQDKVHEFYAVRCLFALFTAYAETRLYAAVSAHIHRTVGMLYLLMALTSAGMFHAATAFLPSTFAMYTTALGAASFISRKTAQGVFWFALGGLLGWPFSLALAVPFVAEELVLGVVSRGIAPSVLGLVRGGMCSLLLLAGIVAIDSFAYQKLVVVPLNIVLYNVFGGEGRGPEIYGTEPWHFYLQNLALNFNLLLPFALLSGPLMVVYYFFRPGPAAGVSPRLATLIAPFYLWLGIFTAQPHKEERFLFPAYPSLLLSAAAGYHLALTIWGSISARVIGNAKLREGVNWTVLACPLILAAVVSLSRTLAVTTAYAAPLSVYSALPQNATGSLCLGKEWYRFPSSYHLPEGVRAKFVESAFDGLLPGAFPEPAADAFARPGTYEMPQGMNDLNIGDPGKYTPVEECDWFVESYFDPAEGVERERDFVLGTEWEEVKCERFLDAARTPTLPRALWMPGGIGGERTWGRYCLLQRREEGEKA